MKIVYGWVVNWSDIYDDPRPPEISVNLFFSSRKRFLELSFTSTREAEILVPVNVPDDFDDLDYIPENY